MFGAAPLDVSPGGVGSGLRAPELVRGSSPAAVGRRLRARRDHRLPADRPSAGRPGNRLTWEGVAPELAKRLDRAVRRALDPDPARRPATAGAAPRSSSSAARESALPTGVVTFVLTDIEGSTGLWESHPEVMAEVIARHHELAADIAEDHRGHMPRSQGEGDSTLSAFGRATDAIAAALAFQRALATEPWPEAIQLRVRAGIHTGEAQVDRGDYFGSAVNRAARVRGPGGRRPSAPVAGHGGARRRPPAGRRDPAGPRKSHAQGPRAGRAGLRAVRRRTCPASALGAVSSAVVRWPRPRRASGGARHRRRASSAARQELDVLRESWTRTIDAAEASCRAPRRRAGHRQDVAHRRVRPSQPSSAARPCSTGAATPRTCCRTSRSSRRSGSTSAPDRRPGFGPTSCAPAPASPASCPTSRCAFPGFPTRFGPSPTPSATSCSRPSTSCSSISPRHAPVLLLLEDLHWADRPTLALLAHLARGTEATPLLVLGTYRSRVRWSTTIRWLPPSPTSAATACSTRSRSRAWRRTRWAGWSRTPVTSSRDRASCSSLRARDRGQPVLRRGDLSTRRRDRGHRRGVHARRARRARGRETGHRPADRSPRSVSRSGAHRRGRDRPRLRAQDPRRGDRRRRGRAARSARPGLRPATHRGGRPGRPLLLRARAHS